MSTFVRLYVAWNGFVERHAWLRWARGWGISAASLVAGLVTVLVFRRGVEYFPLFTGYLLLLWLAGVVGAGSRRSLAARGPTTLSLAIDYTVQTLLHGLFLFLLPIYYASTTLTSGDVWPFALLVAGAVLTTIDPWYRAVLTYARWGELVLFWIGLFASLNAACPLIGVGSEWTLLLSGGLSVLLLIPACREYLGISWAVTGMRVTVGAAMVAVGLWWGREWVPPVPLHLTGATFARAVDRMEPVEPVTRISSEELRMWGRVVAFTAIVVPNGFAEPVYHVWQKNGRALAQMLLATVRGGRRGGFRTYSWKADLGVDTTGLWEVDVRTVHGQLIGRIHLLVTAP